MLLFTVCVGVLHNVRPLPVIFYECRVGVLLFFFKSFYEPSFDLEALNEAVLIKQVSLKFWSQPFVRLSVNSWVCV